MKVLAFFLLAAAASVRPAAAADALWYRIAAETGTPIGFSSETITERPDGREIVDTQEIDVEEKGDPSPTARWFTIQKPNHMTWRTVFREDKSGRTVAVDGAAQNGDDWWRNAARIGDGQAVITRTTPVETRTVTIALAPDVRFDGGDALLANWDPAAVPRLAFDNFNIGAMAVEHVTIEAVAGPARDAEGRLTALRKRFDGNQLVGVARLTIGRDGRIADIRQPMFGSDIAITATSREDATRAHPAYRLLPHIMTKSPYRIPPEALQGHIRYRFAFKDGIVFDLPQTGEQRVTLADGVATVDICSACGPGMADDAATLADALKPTAWLQSDAPAIRDIAGPGPAKPGAQTQQMEFLTKRARSYLGRLDFTGHYSALETLARRAGDCTEAAVLLAALGRAAGIPTRVANGLVYSRESYHGVSNAFMPHSWTLAYVDGAWHSFDSALDVFDATHIALTVGDGDERSVVAANQLAGLLQWEQMAEIKALPAAAP